LKPNYIKAGFWLLLGLNILKLVIIAFDYRFRLNQHIMAFWLCATFLFIPKKVHSLKILILLFYFWSGLLKLNSEWLSGSAIYGHLWLSNSTILPWMCAYVVVLETIMIWCMVFDKKWLSWSVFIQLLIFHLFSYSVVGFYYPVLMTLALFIFPLSWILSPADSTWKWLVSKQASSYACLGLIILFSLLQLIPRLMPGDSALTGEGRFFALHMFDSKSQCETKAFIKGQGGLTKIVDLQINHPIRIHCDPITYLSRARYLCKNASKQDARFLDLDLIIRSRRSNESHLHEIVNITNFCAQKISYSLFSHNDWIHN
jgi:hypothetical protein